VIDQLQQAFAHDGVVFDQHDPVSSGGGSRAFILFRGQFAFHTSPTAPIGSALDLCLPSENVKFSFQEKIPVWEAPHFDRG
jgi:hypothetical protein